MQYQLKKSAMDIKITQTFERYLNFLYRLFISNLEMQSTHKLINDNQILKNFFGISHRQFNLHCTGSI